MAAARIEVFLGYNRKIVEIVIEGGGGWWWELTW